MIRRLAAAAVLALDAGLIAAAGLVVLSSGPAAAQVEAASRVGEEAAKSIIQTGPLGAVFVIYVIGSGIVIAALWKKGKDADALIKDVQEKRLGDTAKYIEQIAKSGSDANTAINGSIAQVADLLRLLNAVFDLVRTLPPAMMAVKDESAGNGVRIEALANFLREKLGGSK